MGRKKIAKYAEDLRKNFTLEDHPEWLTFTDVQVLLRLYMGKGFSRATWNRLVATGQIPAYQDPWGNHIRYRWVEVRQAVDAAMARVCA
jgi:hypothetical protein